MLKHGAINDDLKPCAGQLTIDPGGRRRKQKGSYLLVMATFQFTSNNNTYRSVCIHVCVHAQLGYIEMALFNGLCI